MSDWAEALSKDLRDLAEDVSRLMDNKKRKSEAKDGEVVEERRTRSLQKLTTFYSSKEEAEKMSKADSVTVFIDKKIKEIFKG